MSNGKMDAAELKTLLESSDDAKWEYVITCTRETRQAVEDIPEQIACAIAEQRKRDFRIVAVLATCVATIISLLTPYVLRLC